MVDKEDWTEYVNLFEVDETDEVYVQLKRKLFDRDDFAKIVFFKIGREYSLEWVESSIPAIGNRSVLDCLKNGEVQLIKSLLKRVPS